MSENNTANQEVEQVEQPVETSKEEKFFGVKHQIGKSKDDSTENKNEEVEVEVIDDRPPEDRKPPKVETAKNDVEEEIEGINDKVQKRIDKLKYEYHEERRAKEASDRLREEAVNYAQKIQGENKRLSALINKGEEALLGQISAKSTAELEKAKAEFKEAYEAGNSDAMLAANEKILAAQVDLKSATEKLNYYQQQQEAMRGNAIFWAERAAFCHWPPHHKTIPPHSPVQTMRSHNGQARGPCRNARRSPPHSSLVRPIGHG